MAKQNLPRSYNAGEKGRNWVRAYEDRPGKYYLEWMEAEIDPATGAVLTVVDRRTGQRKPKLKRTRVLLGGVSDLDGAKARADVLAAKFAEAAPTVHRSTTVTAVLTRYLEEATPKKSEGKQGHDRRAAGIFAGFFGTKEARHLDRRDWDNFVFRRQNGEIPGFKPVRPRQVEYDLKFMIAVLGWAAGVMDVSGKPLLEANPWGAERRKARGMKMPKEQTPHRPSMPDWIRDKLIEHAPHPQLGPALILSRYTISRNSSVRLLQWLDIDLLAGTIRWRGEVDKSNREVHVPLVMDALEALKSAEREAGCIWVFPSPKDPSRPTSRDTFQTWLRRAKQRWLRSIEANEEQERIRAAVRGLGFHGEKRAGVRDPWFRSLSDKTKEKLARTNYQTLVSVYDEIELDEMRMEMQERTERLPEGSRPGDALTLSDDLTAPIDSTNPERPENESPDTV